MSSVYVIICLQIVCLHDYGLHNLNKCGAFEVCWVGIVTEYMLCGWRLLDVKMWECKCGF